MTDSSPALNEPTCSLASRTAGEPLIGSAPRTESWLLLEDSTPPGANALMDSSLPSMVKEYLTTVQASLPLPRLSMIRKRRTSSNAGITFYLAAAREESPALYEIHLESYEALLNLDIPAILRGDLAYQVYLTPQPLFIVCTNGKRDPCCARWGAAAYAALAGVPGLNVWQSSHVGGHRFAANVVHLPYGIYYGHVSPQQAGTLALDAQEGCITLENYRGRACYPPEAQAAEYFLRAQTGDRSLESFSLTSIRETGVGEWEVFFTSRTSCESIPIYLANEPTGESIYESCSTPNELKPVKKYRRLDMSAT